MFKKLFKLKKVKYHRDSHIQGEEKNVFDNDDIIIDIPERLNEKSDIEIKGNNINIEEEAIKDINCEKDKRIILQAKVMREKSIKAIDLYTGEEQFYDSYKECSKKLGIPLGYIKENLLYGYTEYLGDAINFLYNELLLKKSNNEELSYLKNGKSPLEQFKALNDKIFESRISEKKRDEILLSPRIDPIKMHYKFECLDDQYDEYFITYKEIIKRGGRKRIDLIDKNGEVLERFKSVDECANYIKKSNKEVVNMLKYGETKVKRFEIKYSLKNI